MFFLTKLFLTAGIIVVVTEVAKRSDKFGGLIAALPLTTILIILWMYYEGASSEKISKHMSYTCSLCCRLCPCLWSSHMSLASSDFTSRFWLALF